MLEIRALMNSPVEDIFAFKTCCGLRALDQNLEIRVKNLGSEAVVLQSYLDLEGEGGRRRIETLMPHGAHRLGPGEVLGFYCLMDEAAWAAARRLVLFDTAGNQYPVDLVSRGEGE